MNKLQTSSNHSSSSNNNQAKNWREREQKETSRQRRDRETEKERKAEVKNSGMKVKMEWCDENETGTGQSSRAAETQHVVVGRRRKAQRGNEMILQAEQRPPNEEDEEWELPSDNSKEPNFVYRADRRDAPNRANEDRGEHQRYESALL